MSPLTGPGRRGRLLDRIGVAVCRGLLRLGPPSFRRAFGADLLAAVTRRAGDVRRASGRRAVARHWARHASDLSRALAGEWIQALRGRRTASSQVSLSSPESMLMDDLRTDLRFALRTLARRPALSAVIGFTLALAIGANTAIFSILDAVVMAPLPYEEPDDLVVFLDDMRAYDMLSVPLAEYEMRRFRESTSSFIGLEAATPPFQVPLTGVDGEPEQIVASTFTTGYLDLLGVRPMLGTDFRAEDGRPLPPGVFTTPGAQLPAGVALLSHGFWQRRFGGDPEIVGRTVEINGRQSEIIGVLPQGFRIFWPAYMSNPAAVDDVDVHVPLQADIANATSGPGYLQVVGRIAEGVTIEQAREEVAAIAARQRQEHERSGRSDIYTRLEPWSSEVSRHVRPALLALVGAVAFVLVIACANVANLLLARAVERRREIAVRAALGARRSRILRQSLTESFLLAGLGAGLGLALAAWGVGALVGLVPSDLPRAEHIGINPEVALFTLLATVVAVLLFGSAPAVVLAGTGGAGALNDRGTGGGSSGRSRLRSALVVMEVALTLVLLVGAGLMWRSFASLQGVDLGFEPARVTTFQVSLPFQYVGGEAQNAFLISALTRIGELPGVEAIGAGSGLPLSGNLFVGTYRTEHMEADAPRREANFRGASRGYFEAVGVPLLGGRTFLLDEPDPAVAIIDRRFAESDFAGRDPVGETIFAVLPSPGGLGNEAVPSPVRVVGVVGDVRDETLSGDGRRTIYFPQELLGFGQYSFVVRARQATSDLLPLVRREIAAIDPELPVYDIRPMTGFVDDALAPTRFTLLLIGLFSGFSILLSAVGLYGVLAHTVREQTRDIGVRMAFGATAGEVLRQVVGRGALLAGIGAALGLAVAVPLTLTLRGLFVGVEPTDPLTLTATTVLLLVVAVLACWLPARRASRMDPAASLRAD